MSLNRLAERAGMRHVVVLQVEDGEHRPHLWTVFKLADALNGNGARCVLVEKQLADPGTARQYGSAFMAAKNFDWLAWWLHLTFGGAVGAALGLALSSGGPYYSEGMWARPALAIPLIAGTSMFVAGLAAKYRDSLWIGRSAASRKPSAPTLKWVRMATLALIIVGAVAMAVSLLVHTFLEWR